MRVGKFQTEYLILTRFRPKYSAICRPVKLKFLRPHVFLSCKIMTGGLLRMSSAANICWGKSLVLNIRQKVKLIFFMHFFELQPGLAFI